MVGKIQNPPIPMGGFCFIFEHINIFFKGDSMEYYYCKEDKYNNIHSIDNVIITYF